MTKKDENMAEMEDQDVIVEDGELSEAASEAAAGEAEGEPVEVDAAELEEAEEELSPEQLAEALENLREENSKLQDRLLRTAAEFENYKRRTQREMSDRATQAEDRLAMGFLPIVDNLERALSAGAAGGGEALVAGVEMVHKQFLGLLERHGIRPVEALGQPFDPEFHEAIQQMHSDEHPAGAVCQELQKGYRRENRLVRAAMVVVSLGPAKSDNEGGEESSPGPNSDEPAGDE